MSSRVEYDPASFHVERLASGAWVTVPAASVSGTGDYSLQDNSQTAPKSKIPTPIVGSENATLTYVRYGTLGTDVLYVGDTVRCRYGSDTFFRGTVESVDITYTRENDYAPRIGEQIRIDVSCQLAGLYGALLSRTVSWTSLPAEPWITRIRRWVTVAHWPDGV